MYEVPIACVAQTLFSSLCRAKNVKSKSLAAFYFRSVENLASPDLPPPPASPDARNFTVYLKRGDMGFGFRIIGGQEENTQVPPTILDLQLTSRGPC